ncbi:hypothetical protein [Aquimarina algiphila]|nr:hypothetical protein [Aquimarina algiphila]
MKTELLYRIMFFLLGSLMPLAYLAYREYKETLRIKKWSKNKQL